MSHHSKAPNLLVLHPEKNSTIKYRFKTEVIRNWDSPHPLTHCFTRDVAVVYTGKEKEDQYTYQFFCTNIIFEAEEYQAGSILVHLYTVFDAIDLSTNRFGEIIAIHNGNHIRLKWEKIKGQLVQEHLGEDVLQYFEDLEKLLQDKKALLSFLNQQKMYGFYFKGMIEYTKADREIQVQSTKTIRQEEKRHFSLNKNTEEQQYKGFFHYLDFQLHDSQAEEKAIHNNSITKYSILCLGSKEKNTR